MRSLPQSSNPCPANHLRAYDGEAKKLGEAGVTKQIALWRKPDRHDSEGCDFVSVETLVPPNRIGPSLDRKIKGSQEPQYVGNGCPVVLLCVLNGERDQDVLIF